MKSKDHELGGVISVNVACFGKQDQYSNPAVYTESVKILEKKVRSETVAYLIYQVLPEYISIDRLGTMKEHRKKGHCKNLMRTLKKIATKEEKPIRTYIRFDNIPSYLLHIKSGFYPTHVAWGTWVWVEYKGG